MMNAFFEHPATKELLSQLGANDTIIRFIFSHTEHLYERANTVGAYEAVYRHLEHSDKLMPAHLTPEQAAKAITETAATFAASCEAEITIEQMQNTIGSKCAEMTSDQALLYLACLHTSLDHLHDAAPADKQAWQQKISSEAEQLMAHGVNTTVEEHIDALVRRVDGNKVDVLFSFANDSELITALQDGISASADAAAEHFDTLFADASVIAAFTAAIYRQALMGTTAHVSATVDPGVLTAHVGAAVNTARIAYAAAANQITAEEAEIKLGFIGRAFAVALTAALELALFVAEYLAVVEIALLIENVVLCSIVSSLLILVIVALMFLQFACFENIYGAFVKLLTKGKSLTVSAVKKLTNSADNTRKQTSANTPMPA